MARMYEFPEESELVVCTVSKVKNFGAFVLLDEYKMKEGFIHIAEVASGWIKYIRDYVREGQKIVCKVLRVDPSKGHIDLSLKQVNEHQRREKIQEWKNEQKAEKLLEIVGKRIKMSVDECYEEFGYDLIEGYETLYRAFEECAVSDEVLKDDGFKGDWIEGFIEVAQENVTPPFVNINGLMELTCPAPDGIVHIREALMKAEGSEEGDITVQYMGAPKYRIIISAPDYKIAEEELKKASERVISYIESHGGEGKFHRKE